MKFNATLGTISLGRLELGATGVSATQATGTFSVSGHASVSFTGAGGLPVVNTIFAAVPGYMHVGAINLGRSSQTLTYVNPHTKSGIFSCSGKTDITFFTIAPTHGSFSIGGNTSVSFFGQLGKSFRVSQKTSVSFVAKAKIKGHFSCSGGSGVSFLSTSTVPPRFFSAGKTSVIFYVRSGQTPTCFYDNGYINPENRIFNYVF